MAGDRRTRRLTDDAFQGERTVDPTAPAPERPVEVDPSELLETPPTLRAGTALEERQKRWFRLREQAIRTAENPASPTDEPVEDRPSDPKD